MARPARRTERFDLRKSVAIVLLAFALFGGAVQRLVHELAVPHRLCRVHGSIEHGVEVESLAPRAAESDGPRYRGDPVRHEECDLPPLARTETALVLAESFSVVAPLVPCGTSFVPAALPPPSVLHLEAPSRSPPA
jgi:hypothetical protein